MFFCIFRCPLSSNCFYCIYPIVSLFNRSRMSQNEFVWFFLLLQIYAEREYCDCIRKSHQSHLFHSSAVWDSGYCVDCAGKCIHDCMCSVVVHRHLAAELFEHRSKIIRDIDIALLLLCVLHVGFCCRLICISAWFHVYDQLHLPNCF